VVEDEHVLRLAVSKALRKEGFSVIEAGDGSTAMDLIRAHPERIDLLLLDVTLPGYRAGRFSKTPGACARRSK